MESFVNEVAGLKANLEEHLGTTVSVISKMNANPKDNDVTITEPHHRHFPQKSSRFFEVILDGGFQSCRDRQEYFQCWH